MGFATPAQVQSFLREAPVLEKMLVDDGLLLFKYWLGCDQEEQEQRFQERLEDPIKRWKLSPIDVQARAKYDEYTLARDEMFEATHTKAAPWTVVDFNSQKVGRLNLIRDLLDRLPDHRVTEEVVMFPPLAGKPAKERYGGPVKPIETAYED
jgi:polyphosphate kinase 2 (PPK2 family)